MSRFTVSKEGNKVIIRPEADLDDIEIADEFKEAVLEQMEKGENEIVVDLSMVNSINSVGLGKLLMIYKRLKNRGGNLYVSSAKGKVKEMLELLMLDTLFITYP